jgi:hypothetical protein
VKQLLSQDVTRMGKRSQVWCCNPSNREVEAGGSHVQGQPGLHSDWELETSQGKLGKSYLKSKINTKRARSITQGAEDLTDAQSLGFNL